ncbi:hypothetical protein MTO96_028887 [Rhipicephalus appendiculatus]
MAHPHYYGTYRRRTTTGRSRGAPPKPPRLFLPPAKATEVVLAALYPCATDKNSVKAPPFALLTRPVCANADTCPESTRTALLKTQCHSPLRRK